MLLDRLPERAALSGLLDGARAGRSGVLVVRGEPGVGKTALPDWAIESVAGLRVAGVESEMELAFAALQQLYAPMLDKLESLPAPQRAALGVAFGLNTGAAPDRFLMGPSRSRWCSPYMSRARSTGDCVTAMRGSCSDR